MVSSLTLGESIVPGRLSINKGFYWPNLDFLGTGFGYIENTFSMIGGAIDGYRKIKHLFKISGLEVASDWLMGIGMFINAGLSVYDNFIYSNNLSLDEKLLNVTGDVAYILVSSGIIYGVGYLTAFIPFVGPFIAPITALLSGIVLDQIWTGEDILRIKGWSIEVNDKSLEEWFKDVLTEWLGG